MHKVECIVVGDRVPSSRPSEMYGLHDRPCPQLSLTDCLPRFTQRCTRLCYVTWAKGHNEHYHAASDCANTTVVYFYKHTIHTLDGSVRSSVPVPLHPLHFEQRPLPHARLCWRYGNKTTFPLSPNRIESPVRIMTPGLSPIRVLARGSSSWYQMGFSA